MEVASHGGRSDPYAGPGSSGPLVRSLAGFARTVSLAGGAPEVLHDLTRRVASLAGSMGAGVNLFVDDRLVHAASSRPTLMDLELRQQEYQEGPCVDAARSGRSVLVADLSAEGGRWPRYSPHAGRAGVRSVAAVPLNSAGSILGAINIYHSSPRTWPEPVVRPLALLGDLAAGFLALDARIEEQRRITAELQRQLDSRVVVEQARGIVAAHRGVDVDRALELIRGHAERHGASVQATADAVVRLGLRP